MTKRNQRDKTFVPAAVGPSWNAEGGPKHDHVTGLPVNIPGITESTQRNWGELR